jgi:hypothetical protein
LEGVPPDLEGVEEIFLWGMKVCGSATSQFQYSCTLPGESDDAATWFAFLDLAKQIFCKFSITP